MSLSSHACSTNATGNTQTLVPTTEDNRTALTAATIGVTILTIAIAAWFWIPVIPSSVWIALVFVGGIVAVLHNTRGGTR